MPFIPFEQRQEVRDNLAAGRGLQEPGELSFIVADAIDAYVGEQFDFARLAAALGAVESAVDQFKQRVVNPYEERKRLMNKEVFVLSSLSAPVMHGPGWPE